MPDLLKPILNVDGVMVDVVDVGFVDTVAVPVKYKPIFEG